MRVFSPELNKDGDFNERMAQILYRSESPKGPALLKPFGFRRPGATDRWDGAGRANLAKINSGLPASYFGAGRAR